ncbi:hypothetical protein J2R96_002023 [Bradyrhizobium elkanii]|nr:hypothetical protein [Bradyrhizobium elkanii]
MGAFAIVVGDPCREFGPGIVETEEQRLIQELVAHPAVKALDEAVYIGLPGAMKCQSMPVSLHQTSMALQVSSVPLSDDQAGFAAPRDNRRQFPRPRRPEIDVSGIAPRHSLVTSSTMLRMR